MTDQVSKTGSPALSRVTLRFYEELNDLLRQDQRKKDIVCEFPGKRSVKDAIESFGVPHTEVDLILVNGVSEGFGYLLKDGDRVSVYPVFESLCLDGITKVRPKPLRTPSFVADVHLGKLARNLRLLGFDTDYRNSRDDAELAAIAAAEKRILLTRDRRLLMRKMVDRGILLHNEDPFKQTLEVLDRLDLWDTLAPFSRCLACSGPMSGAPPGSDAFARAEPSIPPLVRSWCSEYYRCSQCGNVYWKGSHYDRLQALVQKFLAARSSRQD